MKLWINHPVTKKPSATLTFSVWALGFCLLKFLFNGMEIEIMEKTIKFGTTDPGLIAALLTPTLATYASKKFAKPQAQPTESEYNK